MADNRDVSPEQGGAGEGDTDDTSGDQVPSAGAAFIVLETHDVGDHHLRVYGPAEDSWLQSVAAEYRRLRTSSRLPAEPLSFEGVTILDVEGVEAMLADACVPQYQAGNFGVVRSDLAEVILGAIFAEEYGCSYGYQSVCDRELRQLPGRGIDQIGIEGTTDRGLALVLGEAKVSMDRNCPPGVVDRAEDGLRQQHLGHLADLSTTADKVLEASKNATNPMVQGSLRIAAWLLRHGDERLRIVAASVMVRPEGTDVPADFGSFHASVEDFAPANVRFLLIRVPGDFEELVRKFLQLASAGPEAAA